MIKHSGEWAVSLESLRLYGIEGTLRVSTCADKGKYFHMYRFRGGHPDMAASDQYARYTNTGKARKESN